MANYGRFLWRRGQLPSQPAIIGFLATTSVTTFPLSSAAATGAQYGFSFTPMENANLTDIWVAPASFTGSWSATDQLLNADVRVGLTAANRPGASSAGTFTIPLAGTDSGKWVKKSGLSISLTAGVLYCLIIGDNDGSGSNFVTMNSSFASSPGTNWMSSTMTTANGWTAGAGVANSPCAIFKIGGKIYGGGVHGGSLVAFASSTRRRGNKIVVTSPAALVGFAQSSNLIFHGTGGQWTGEIFVDAALPNSTPAWTYAFPAGVTATSPVPSCVPVPLDNQFLFVPGHSYRVLVRPVSNSTAPSMLPTFAMDAGDEADIRSLFAPDGIDIMATEEATATTWTDFPLRVSTVGLVLAMPFRPTLRF